VSTDKTYGILIRGATTRAELEEKIDYLARCDPDRVVLLSVAPHDVMRRPDWSEIDLMFQPISSKLDVLQVKVADIEYISSTLTVLKENVGLIACRKPYYYQAQGGWEIEHERGERPVIAILNPQLTFEALKRSSCGFSPVGVRLEPLLQIPENGYFEMPEVLDGHSGGIGFSQGRHRTTALAMLGYKAYPVVTTDRDVDSLLLKFGASLSVARQHFDWSKIEDYPVKGT